MVERVLVVGPRDTISMVDDLAPKGFEIVKALPADIKHWVRAWDKAGTDESLKVARDWIQKNAADIGASPPAVMEGSVILQVK